MASITCRNRGVTHSHSSVIESKICYGIISAPTHPRTYSPGLVAVDMVTGPQMKYIKDLGGDLTYAAKLTKAQASKYIDDLKSGRAPKVTSHDEDRPGEEVKSTTKSEMIKGLIGMVPDAYYAVRQQEGAPITFLRVARPKGGNFRGAIKVSSQHGPALEPRWALWPSNKVSVYRWPGHDIEEALLLLIADWKGATRLYAEKAKRCGRCNTKLTDPRSRFYLIGPECEQKPGWGFWIEEVAAERGGFWEQQPLSVQEKYLPEYEVGE